MSMTVLALLMALTGDSVTLRQQEAVRTVASVDLDRYLGTWYEVARLPNRFQRSCARDVTATYAKRPDGRIDVVNRCRTEEGRTIEASGVARVVDQSSARLKVRFAPAVLSFLSFVWGDYWVIGLADDYSWAVVGSPDRTYLWILARTPVPDAGLFEAGWAAARDNGFDVDRLAKTIHTVPSIEAGAVRP
jgi:apolipoprotein D and lipocalin family protein